MLRFREIEHTALYAGLGVRLIDAHTGAPAFGWTKVELEIEDGGGFRPIEAPRALSAGGVIWFPWLERHRDARGLLPRRYRVRVSAAAYAPRYSYDSDGVEALVAPYDDVTVPPTPLDPIDILLLPSASYPFAPQIPLLRGVVVDLLNQPVPGALVTWIDGGLVTDSVLSDDDGEFDLPMRRAPLDTPIDVRAERPAGAAGQIIVSVPQDVGTFQTIQIV